jgi:hypothetical protein
MLIHKYRWHSVLDFPNILLKSLRKFQNPPKCRICGKHICPGHKRLKVADKILISDILVVAPQEYLEDSENDDNPESAKYEMVEREMSQIFRENSSEEPRKPGQSTSTSNFQCNICSKSFSAYKNLYQHKLSHNSPSFKCDVESCNKIFKRRHGLHQHIQRDHINLKKYKCAVCDHDYFFKNDMIKCRHTKRSWKS